MRAQGKAATCRGRLPLFAAPVAVTGTEELPRGRPLRGRWPIPASPRPPLPARLSVPRA
ncbi:hypothetical protein [Streptomyces lydicus]|uniref:hypothetical protein n=1 Tax=Streptomyces lydicus TaxID=47763 RepID=UPI00286FC316|nr:hypothetical protein [Streptomyces lydicus]